MLERVEQIKTQVEALSADELAEFRSWYFSFDAAAWNQEVALDATTRLPDHFT